VAPSFSKRGTADEIVRNEQPDCEIPLFKRKIQRDFQSLRWQPFVVAWRINEPDYNTVSRGREGVLTHW
jgi:hypothetical protein